MTITKPTSGAQSKFKFADKIKGTTTFTQASGRDLPGRVTVNLVPLVATADIHPALLMAPAGSEFVLQIGRHQVVFKVNRVGRTAISYNWPLDTAPTVGNPLKYKVKNWAFRDDWAWSNSPASFIRWNSASVVWPSKDMCVLACLCGQTVSTFCAQFSPKSGRIYTHENDAVGIARNSVKYWAEMPTAPS